MKLIDIKPGKLYQVNVHLRDEGGFCESIEMFLSYDIRPSVIKGYTLYHLNFLKGKTDKQYSFMADTPIKEIHVSFVVEIEPC